LAVSIAVDFESVVSDLVGFDLTVSAMVSLGLVVSLRDYWSIPCLAIDRW